MKLTLFYHKYMSIKFDLRYVQSYKILEEFDTKTKIHKIIENILPGFILF